METQKQGQRPREFTRWCRALAGTQSRPKLRQQAGQFRAGEVSPQDWGRSEKGSTNKHLQGTSGFLGIFENDLVTVM